MHYRAIPEEEYQQLKQLADLNERAIREVVTNTIESMDYYKDLEETKSYIRECKGTIDNYRSYLRDLMFKMRFFINSKDYEELKEELKKYSL